MTAQASKRLLRGRAEVAIEHTADGKVDGLCDPVCVEFCRLVEQLGYETNGLARVNFLGVEPHYVAIVSGHQVEFTDASTLLVDPTIQQFESLLEEEPEQVIFVDSNDPRWDRWYPDLESISDNRVSDFRAEL